MASFNWYSQICKFGKNRITDNGCVFSSWWQNYIEKGCKLPQAQSEEHLTSQFPTLEKKKDKKIIWELNRSSSTTKWRVSYTTVVDGSSKPCNAEGNIRRAGCAAISKCPKQNIKAYFHSYVITEWFLYHKWKRPRKSWNEEIATKIIKSHIGIKSQIEHPSQTFQLVPPSL